MTPGQRVKIWLVGNGMKHGELAVRLGVSRITVSKWLNGKQVPSQDHRHAMQELCGVEPEAWG